MSDLTPQEEAELNETIMQANQIVLAASAYYQFMLGHSSEQGTGNIQIHAKSTQVAEELLRLTRALGEALYGGPELKNGSPDAISLEE